MANNLTIGNFNFSLDKPEYAGMLQNIQNNMAVIDKNTSNFYKSHSQFMQVTLDITAITPIRAVKHTLAEIERTKLALEEAYISIRKKEIELNEKQEQLENIDKALTNKFTLQRLEIEILEIQTLIKNVQNSVSGALRKLNFLVNQHKQLLEKLGKDHITEEEYELEEVKYHIMTAMKQALIAARARNGLIDEGNLIYLFDLGINGADAQIELIKYFNIEQQYINENKPIPHAITVQWLEACAEKWASNPQIFANYRGFSLFDKSSCRQLS